MALRHVAVATTLALLGALLAASPSPALAPGPSRGRPVPAPDVTVLRGGDHLPSSVVTNVPPGGTSMVTTPTLDPTLTTLKVTVKPKNATDLELEDYQNFINGVGQLSKRKKLLVCTMMYSVLLQSGDWYDGQFMMEDEALTEPLAILLSCLHLAGLVNAPPERAAAKGTRCSRAVPSIPAALTKTTSGYRIDASGTTTRAKKSRLKIRCTQKGSTFTYRIRSSTKGEPLRKAVGKKLAFGLKSPNDATTTVPIQVTFARG